MARKSLGFNATLASVCWSNTVINAVSAWSRTRASRQRSVNTHWLFVEKHSTIAKAGSVARTTSPRQISLAGRPAPTVGGEIARACERIDHLHQMCAGDAICGRYFLDGHTPVARRVRIHEHTQRIVRKLRELHGDDRYGRD